MSVIHLLPEDGIGGVEIAAKTVRQDDGFRLLFIRDGRSGNIPAGYPRALRTILRAAPDLLICSLWKSIPVALAAKRLRPRMRLVFFLHNDVAMHAIDAALSRLAIRMADAVWADSAAVLAARRIPATTPTRAISFVTHRLVADRAPVAVPRFVSWGRLHRQKGVDRALPFIAALVARGVDAHYDAYGPDDGERAALIAQAARLGIGNRVRFPGAIPHDRLPKLTGDYGFFLQLSRAEGMCMAAVEAMQLGLVPVTTAVGEMARYVRPGTTGILADPDDLGPAIDAVLDLLVRPDAFAAMSDAAHRHWRDAPLYADDIRRAANEALRRS